MLLLSHYFPNPAVFDPSKIGLRKFNSMWKHVGTLMRMKDPVSSQRDFVEREMEEIIKDPEKIKEILGDEIDQYM